MIKYTLIFILLFIKLIGKTNDTTRNVALFIFLYLSRIKIFQMSIFNNNHGENRFLEDLFRDI